MAAPIYKGGRPFFGSAIRGVKAATASSSATVTLKRSQSLGTFLFDRASGTSYTLPTPKVGLQFDFLVSVLQTSGANLINTSGATVFLSGSIISFSGEDVTPSSTLGPKMFAGNGSSHVKITTNGTTLGGGIGSWFRLTCLSTTSWYVQGVVKSPSGTIATPFST